MATTYTLISSVTVGTNTPTSIDFTNIPATYTDLLLVCSVRNTTSDISLGLGISFNGSSSNFTQTYLQGSGSGTDNASGAYRYIGEYNANLSTSNTFTNTEVYIFNYASSNYKSFSVNGAQENNTTTAYLHLGAGLWSNTSAITSIGLTRSANNTASFAQYSTAYLYGISSS